MSNRWSRTPAPDHVWHYSTDEPRRFNAYNSDGVFVQRIFTRPSRLARYERMGWTFKRAGGLLPDTTT